MPTIRRGIPTLPEPISPEVRLRVQARQALELADAAATLGDVATAKAQAIAAIPPLASTTPAPEMTGGSPGAAMAVPRADHAHPRLTSTTGPHTLDASGKVTVLFTRTFTKAPGLAFTRITDTDTQDRDVTLQASYIITANLYVGVIVRGRKSAVLPTLTSLSVGALLSGVITGVNAIVTALSGFDVFGTPAAGAKFTCIAVQSSE